MSQRSTTGCFKYGCLGCGAFFALLFGGVALLVAMGMTSDLDTDPEERTIDQILPGTPELDPDARDLPEDGSAVEPPLDGMQPDGPAMTQPAVSTALERPLVELAIDLAMGDFFVEAGPPGQPVRVESEFDGARFDLETQLMELDEDNEYRYAVRFASRGGFVGLIARGGASSQNVSNRVKIIVPRDQRLRLVGQVSTGESSFELGGLWLEEVNLDLKLGDHFVNFGEPTLGSMESFEVTGRMAEIELRRLGDASPEQVQVSQRMGELLLDLHGAWRQDATVGGVVRMGELTFWAPDAAHLVVDQFVVGMGQAYNKVGDRDMPEGLPTVRLEASSRMGDLTIEP